MFEFLLGIIGNWVAELGSEIPYFTKDRLLPNKNLVQNLPKLYQQALAKTIDDYWVNPTEIGDLSHFYETEANTYFEGRTISFCKINN